MASKVQRLGRSDPPFPGTGDLLFFDGIGHVSMYVGGGYMIDAPRTGLTAGKIPVNSPWYAQTFVGVARP